jgi:nucleotide-binding universal stress UspA family protein
MKMKILIAVDGSKSSESAVKFAAKIFKIYKKDIHITLLTIQDDTALKVFKKYSKKGAVDDFLREESDKDLAWSIKYLKKTDLPHDMVIRYGNPCEEIITEIKSSPYELIILGAKGRSVWTDLILGSVAQRISAISPIPVMVVKE